MSDEKNPYESKEYKKVRDLVRVGPLHILSWYVPPYRNLWRFYVECDNYTVSDVFELDRQSKRDQYVVLHKALGQLLEATAPVEEGQCAAKQHSDQMVCPPCSLRWDMNDPCPPKCGRDK